MSEAAPAFCILPRELADLCRIGDDRQFFRIWPPHENLYWPRLRPFRRHAFRRALRGQRQRDPGILEMALHARAGGVAGVDR